VGDVYFPQTKLLLPFEGTNGATTTSDLSNNNASVTFNNSAQISTSQSKFGGSSLSCPNGLTDDVATSWNAMPTGTEDFAIEMWAYLLDRTGGGRDAAQFSIFGNRNTSAGDNVQLYVGYPSSYLLAFLINDTALQLTTSWNFTSNLNAWHHIAVTREGNTFRIFINGTQETSATYTGSMTKSFTDLYIGSGGHTWSTTRALRGYIDDFRITRGFARYTAAFTPPTSTHLTSAGDVNKQVLINSTADGVAIGTGGISQARIAKAWCNIDGTGTISIRGSYNVASLTDVGTGKYKVNFSTAMLDEGNYVAFCSGAEVNGGSDQNHLFHLKRESSSANILNEDYVFVASANAAATQTDDGLFCVIVFGS
jgi:hypothetical protein